MFLVGSVYVPLSWLGGSASLVVRSAKCLFFGSSVPSLYYLWGLEACVPFPVAKDGAVLLRSAGVQGRTRPYRMLLLLTLVS